MKKSIRVFSFILCAIIFSSCKDEIVLTGDFDQKYVLTCILRGDSVNHIATLTRTYMPDGIQPLQDTTAKSVRGASITIKHKGLEYLFSEAAKPRIDTSRYKSPIHYYYLKDFKPEKQQTVEINAVMPDGSILKSSIQIPLDPVFDFANSDDTIPEENKNEITVIWNHSSSNLMFDNRLAIIYYIKEGEEFRRYTKYVPFKYGISGGEEAAVYGDPSFEKYSTYNLDIIKRAMEEISAGDPDKSKYYIANAVFQLFMFDQGLTSYFITSNYLDTFSIRLDEIDGSNIEGGYGIFGWYNYKETNLALSAGFIREFGYNPYTGR